MSFPFFLLLITALIFDFLNGFHDSANIVATPIASRAMSPRRVLWLAAFNISGWNALVIIGVSLLPSGRAALLVPSHQPVASRIVSTFCQVD